MLTTAPYTLIELLQVYEGSDGAKTMALYETLKARGPLSDIALNLFRAHKASARAKVYRGGDKRGSYRRQAYDKKGWSIENLCRLLAERAEASGIRWGWKLDPQQAFHCWVLYVDLPDGQVSFHAAERGTGPDYDGEWDGVTNLGPTRICMLIQKALAP